MILTRMQHSVGLQFTVKKSKTTAPSRLTWFTVMFVVFEMYISSGNFKNALMCFFLSASSPVFVFFGLFCCSFYLYDCMKKWWSLLPLPNCKLFDLFQFSTDLRCVRMKCHILYFCIWADFTAHQMILATMPCNCSEYNVRCILVVQLWCSLRTWPAGSLHRCLVFLHHF